jgi:hypothetical protein
VATFAVGFPEAAAAHATVGATL